MKYLLTNARMRAAEKYTIEERGILSLTLMERAGTALADFAEQIAPRGRIVCVCGGGNNGGDGFVCARVLQSRGREVEAVFLAEKSSAECQINRSEFEMMGGKIKSDLPEGRISLLIDCLFGTGFHGEASPALDKLGAQMNGLRGQGVKILAADLPSGINGDNGIAARNAVQADYTLCFGERKIGAVLADGLDCCGEVHRADIGIEIAERESCFLLDDGYVGGIVKPRKRNSHKGNYGRAAIVAGCEKYTGAAYLSALACLRSGAGYTTLFLPEKLIPYYVLKAPEALLESINEGGRVAFNEENFEKLLAYDSIAYGMGLGESEDVALGAEYLVLNYTGRLILDADALNSLARYKKEGLKALFAAKKCDVVLTPHVKEFSRLSARTTTEILQGGLAVATEFAKEYGVTLLLKNAASIVTDGARVAANTAGCAGQAKGGSGDVLSGVVAGLLAGGLDVFEGVAAAAYLAGRAAELAAQTQGDYALLATDVIDCLGRAFLSVRGN